MKKHWPLPNCNTWIPIGDHDGAFGHRRRFDMHTGVDLYCKVGQPVVAVEDGEVVGIEIFTGPRAQSPWWHETNAVLIAGESGVLLYGELQEVPGIRIGARVTAGTVIGHILQVRRKDWRSRLRRLWHGRLIDRKPATMLHFERYTPGTIAAVWWNHDEPKPENLLDPTDLLRDTAYVYGQ